jgi:hypothetical protein
MEARSRGLFFMFETIKAMFRPAEQKQSRAAHLIAIESGGRAQCWR